MAREARVLRYSPIAFHTHTTHTHTHNPPPPGGGGALGGGRESLAALLLLQGRPDTGCVDLAVPLPSKTIKFCVEPADLEAVSISYGLLLRTANSKAWQDSLSFMHAGGNYGETN